jgi:hypothetical protein
MIFSPLNKRRRHARAFGNSNLTFPGSAKTHSRRRQAWRQLLVRVWGADPLRCPCCGALMHKKKVVEAPAEICQTLVTLGLWEGLIALPPPHGPPQKRRRTAVWALDTGDGHPVDFEPGSLHGPLPTDRRTKPPRERYFSGSRGDDTSTIFDESPPPDQTWTPEVRPREDGLLLV